MADDPRITDQQLLVWAQGAVDGQAGAEAAHVVLLASEVRRLRDASARLSAVLADDRAVGFALGVAWDGCMADPDNGIIPSWAELRRCGGGDEWTDIMAPRLRAVLAALREVAKGG